MGLDMYLYRKTYVKNRDYMDDGKKWAVTVSRGGEQIPVAQVDPARIVYVTEEVAYWRKANQVHAWFVREVQGGEDQCEPHYVEQGQLAELVSLCRQVLADHSLARELLPAQSGFFFGGTDYDEYYFGDLEETVRMLEPLLTDEARSLGEFEYRSSW